MNTLEHLLGSIEVSGEEIKSLAAHLATQRMNPAAVESLAQSIVAQANAVQSAIVVVARLAVDIDFVRTDASAESADAALHLRPVA